MFDHDALHPDVAYQNCSNLILATGVIWWSITNG